MSFLGIHIGKSDGSKPTIHFSISFVSDLLRVAEDTVAKMQGKLSPEDVVALGEEVYALIQKHSA